MAIIHLGDKEVELLSPEQVLQLHAISQLRRLLPRYEATRDPALFAEIQQWTDKLPVEDGIPMEDLWHVFQMHLLLELTKNRWIDRFDYFAGGNIFVYYSLEQAEEIVLERETAYRGPDFFVVKDVDGRKMRRRWVVWEE
ncbi:MAG: hypothetical protein NZ843_06305, partial [Fimbriimonadales bacterium]|nr:hypothetical protein [Fimbriimonadales bacterium]